MMAWVETNCEFAHRTATNYIKLACSANLNPAAPESIGQALRMLTGDSGPEEQFLSFGVELLILAAKINSDYMRVVKFTACCGFETPPQSLRQALRMIEEAPER